MFRWVWIDGNHPRMDYKLEIDLVPVFVSVRDYPATVLVFSLIRGQILSEIFAEPLPGNRFFPTVNTTITPHSEARRLT